MVKISVIIPTYNYAHFLPLALESVLNQNYKNFEIIIVDDGSEDDTEKIVKNISKKNGGVKIHYIKHPKNLGFAEAMNSGVSVSNGEYINFLSADDILLPNFLEKEVTLLDKEKGVAMVYSAIVFIDEKGKRKRKQKLRKWQILKDSYSSLIIGNHINLVTCLVRSKLLKVCGHFNPKIKQMPDWDMWLRVSKKGNIAYIPEYLALYRVHKASLTGAIRQNFENIGKERKIVLEKTIKNDFPKKIAPWLPLLFLDAYTSSDKLPKAIQKILAIFSTGISILTTKLIRLFYRFC